jgi:hypothetical protein
VSLLRMSAYVSIRQHTSVYLAVLEAKAAAIKLAASISPVARGLRGEGVRGDGVRGSGEARSLAIAATPLHTAAYGSIRQRMSAYGSVCQHTGVRGGLGRCWRWRLRRRLCIH